MPKGKPTAGTREWSAHNYLNRIQVGKNADGSPKYKYKYEPTKLGFKKVPKVPGKKD